MKFDDLLLHPRTRTEFTALLKDAPHAILLIAPAGSGKLAASKAWARLLTVETSISIVAPEDGGSISIDNIRALYKTTRTRQAERQIVIIDHAEAMGVESQNAFLKLLEEPRPNLTFILTATNKEDILPTIASRAQSMFLQPIAYDELAKYARTAAPQISNQELAQMLFIANGRPALLASILNDPNELEAQKAVMQRAKSLLSSNQYERLAQINSLTKDRGGLVGLLDAMARMLSIQLQVNPNNNLIALAERLDVCQSRLRQNGNPRAQLLHLFAGQ